MSAQDILESINQLLEELNTFLNSKILRKKLASHPELQNEAERLLNETKNKRDSIKKLVELLSGDNYVDMQKLPVENDLPDAIYSDYIEQDNQEVDSEDDDEYWMPKQDLQTTTETIQPTENTQTEVNNSVESLECPYKSSIYNQLIDNAIKNGPLYRKEKRFILDKKTMYQAILIENWLLLYTSKKEKPSKYIDITDHEARKKKEPMFEIISDGKKPQEFYAKNVKEMENWITSINDLRSSGNVTPYQDIGFDDENDSKLIPDENSDEIYISIENVKLESPHEEKSKTKKKKEKENKNTLKKKEKQKLPDIPPELPKRSKNFKLNVKEAENKETKGNPELIRYYNWQEPNNVSDEIEEEVYDEPRRISIEEEKEEPVMKNTSKPLGATSPMENLNKSLNERVSEEIDDSYDDPMILNSQPRTLDLQIKIPGINVPEENLETQNSMEEEIYDDISIIEPISFEKSLQQTLNSLNRQKNIKNELEKSLNMKKQVSKEEVEKEEEDIYDEPAALILPVNSKISTNQIQEPNRLENSRKISSNQIPEPNRLEVNKKMSTNQIQATNILEVNRKFSSNQIPEPKTPPKEEYIEDDEEIYSDIPELPKKERDIYKTQVSDDYPEDDIYDDPASLLPPPEVVVEKSPEKPVLSKISALQQEFLRKSAIDKENTIKNKPECLPKPQVIRKLSTEKKDKIFINKDDNNSPKKLHKDIILQMEGQLKLSKR